MIAGLEQGSLPDIAAAMGNVLEDVTIPMHPVIEGSRDEMKSGGSAQRDDERQRPYRIRPV